jgi:hypothetical protein
MNQADSEPAPGESTPPPAPYKDRSTGLVVFGIFSILLGGLAVLTVSMFLIQDIVKAAKNQVNLETRLPSLAIHGFLAVALVWLGIGSVMARRWARSLLLIFSWCWLIMGVVLLYFVALDMPHLLANVSVGRTEGQPASNAIIRVVVMAVLLLLCGVYFIVLPTVWIFFYGSRHVKATSEARDPLRRWTDACPMPVLGLFVPLMTGASSMLLMSISGHCVTPFFGKFLTGIPSSLCYLAFAAIWSYAAWSLYKLRPFGWWLILMALLVYMVSAILTLAQHDMTEMYRLMGYSEAELEEMQRSGMLTANHKWLVSLANLPFIAYLPFIKRFIPRSGDEGQAKS